ncbi:MAG: T9SS type A sorting domain-containing protein [Saprospirales bacterium]|nr:T9SS type A sorting domain-containing protein [Saprospirales bacterium]
MKNKNSTQTLATSMVKWVLAMAIPFLLGQTVQAQTVFPCETSATYVEAFGQAGTTFLGSGDDSNYTLALPFTFNLFGTNYTSVTAGTHGYLGFGGTRGLGNVDVPTTLTGGAMYPYWDDLDAGPTIPNTGIYYRTDGVSPNQVFTIEWYHVGHFGDVAGQYVTFQVQLFETTNAFKFCYEDVFFGGTQTAFDRGASATVGVEGVGVQATRPWGRFSFNAAALNDNTCIEFFPALACTPVPSGTLNLSTSPTNCEVNAIVPVPVSSPAGCAANLGLKYKVGSSAFVTLNQPFPPNVVVPGLGQGPHTVTWQYFSPGCPLVVGPAVTQTINVADEIDPIAICPADIVVNLDPGLCAAFVSYTVTGTDNCPFTGPSGMVSTINASNNSGSVGGMVYFDIHNLSGGNLTITELGMRITAATMVNIYLKPDTYVGSTGNAAAWTLAGTADATGGPFTPSLTPAPTNFILPPGNWGVALHTLTAGNQYTNGTGANQFFTDGTVELSLGAASNTPWVAAAFTPRVWNGYVTYQSPSVDPEPVQTSGLPSGIEYPMGTVTNCFSITDIQGNVGTCCFDVTVLEYQNPTATLACNDNVQISLDETGCVEVLADMVLEGGPYGCYDDYIVEILNQFGFPTGNQVCCSDVGLTKTVRVTDPDTGNKCWGSLTVEDKLPPIIECLNFDISCTQDFPDHPHPEISIGSPPATLATVNAPNNGNSSGGMVWFDVENLTGGDVTVTELGVNVSGATMVDVYLRPGTYVGNTGGPAGWTLVAQADATTGPFAGAVIGGPVITPAPTNFVIPAGTWGVALHALSAAQSYTNGTGANQSFTDGNLTITLGSTANTPWGAAFTPRVWNGYITYSSLFEADLIEPTDNCEVVDLSFVETIQNGTCDGESQTITRIWTATDQSGNHSSCTQTITRKRPTLADIELPPSYDGVNNPALDCSGNGWDTNGNGYPDPSETGGITITGNPFVNEDICEMTATYEDIMIPICEGTFKVVRKWLVIDWCTVEQLAYDQVIKVADQTGPTVVCPTGPLTINVYQGTYSTSGPHDVCKGNVVIQPLEVTGDDCSSVNPASYKTELWTLGAGTLLQSITGNGGTFTNVELIADNPPTNNAQYTVRHTFMDVCGNQSECIYNITVIDKVPPVPICDEITELALTNSGGSGEGCSILPAKNLDDGSYDNCGDVFFYAAKMNPFLTPPYFYQYYKTLEYCCDEVGDNMVIVLVLDFDPTTVPGATLPDGSVFLFPGNPIFEGSFNTCMVTVGVTDKIPPVTLFCPANQTINCDTYLNTYASGVSQGDYSVLAGFGFPQFFDNCNYDEVYTVTVNLNNCTEGSITRNWTASDSNGQVSCTQTITVTHKSDWVVEFPADFTGQCTNGQLPDTGEPKIFHDECELIGVSHEDQLFTIVPDACYKIVRTWNVINWCIYDDFGYDAYLETGHAECNLNQDWDGDGDKDCRTFRDGYNSTGNPGTPDGYISYKQVIKVIDNEAPAFTIPAIDGCITDTDCNTNITLPYPDITDDCSLANEVTITGDFGTFNNITGDVTVANVGVGEYDVTYAVTDNCGNTGYQTITVVVEDCKKPTPLCDNGLVVEIMQTQMVEVWADAFDEGSFDNCGPITSFSFSPDVTDLTHIFTCDDLGQQPVQIWVTDIYGNQDYCETFIVIQDNMGFCGGGVPAVVAGAVATETEAGVQGVNVEVNGGIFSQFTDLSGNYTFNLVAGGDYTVTPMLDLNPSNGVTTWDLVLISRHILGIQPLDSPYKMIAADANKSNSVTTLDMVHIRKVILQIEPGFPNNTSWRFVDKDFVFPNPANPFAATFPEVINYNNLTADDLNADFVAVKVGDVNGSAATSLNGDVEDRTFNGSMNIDVQDQQLKAGKTYTVDFTAEAIDLLGYQFTLNYNTEAIEIQNLVAGVAGEENFGMLLEEGVLTTSWNVSEARALAQGEVLFSLVVKANADVALSEVFGVSSTYTAAEAYGADGVPMAIGMMFNGTEATGFALYQNVPNPFKGETVIGFTLPEASTATLTVMDVSGKVLVTVAGEYAKGYNEVRLGSGETSFATGVLYYQLDTPTHSATKKMVIIE